MATFRHAISVGYSVLDTTSPGAAAMARAGTGYVDADGNKGGEVTVPGSTTNQPVALAFDKDNLKSVLILVTDGAGGGQVTLKTNSTGSPDTTLTVKKNGPIVWNSDMGTPNPFTAADVTQIFLTNAGTSAVTVTILVLEDI